MSAMMRRPAVALRANACVSAAAARGMRISTTKARRKGSGSMAETTPGPMKSNKYTGSSNIWSNINTGAAANNRSLAPPASPVNTMT